MIVHVCRFLSVQCELALKLLLSSGRTGLLDCASSAGQCSNLAYFASAAWPYVANSTVSVEKNIDKVRTPNSLTQWIITEVRFCPCHLPKNGPIFRKSAITGKRRWTVYLWPLRVNAKSDRNNSVTINFSRARCPLYGFIKRKSLDSHGMSFFYREPSRKHPLTWAGVQVRSNRQSSLLWLKLFYY